MEPSALLRVTVQSVELELETNGQVFSPTSVDTGTLAMLSLTEFIPGGRVLDLGCGYGVVGILAARLVGEEFVTLCDISEDAVALSRRNAVRNGVGNVTTVVCDGPGQAPGAPFSLILSNPPYHADFSVPKKFIEQGWRQLADGGKLLMVTKRLDWYKNKITAIFGGVTVRELDGYSVFIAEKRPRVPKKSPKGNTLSKKLQRKYGNGSRKE